MSSVVLPEGWALSKIADISIRGVQRTPEAHERFTYVDIGSIDREIKAILEPQYLLGETAPSRARKVINTGDIVVSLTRPNLNAVALVSDKYDNQIASTGFEVIKPALVDSRYIFALVRSKDFIDAISGKVQGALYPAAKASDVQEYNFPLPPLAEQKVIAAKLDELLAQVDILKTRLTTIPTLLKRFRQSVLAAAVSGKLTEEWKENSSLDAKKISDISTLVTKGASPNWQGINYVEDNTQTLFVTSENVGSMKILLEKKKYVEDSFNQKQKRSVLMKNDVLTNIVGASIGRAVVWSYDTKSNINQAVCLIRLNPEECIPDYLMYFLNSPIGIDALVGQKVDVARANVSLEVIKNLELLIPPLEEQTEIVRRVEQLFAFADQIEQQVKNAQSRVNNLTQSILAKAFRGELTADWRAANPDLITGENSAQALLAKIKAERDKPKKTPKQQAMFTE